MLTFFFDNYSLPKVSWLFSLRNHTHFFREFTLSSKRIFNWTLNTGNNRGEFETIRQLTSFFLLLLFLILIFIIELILLLNLIFPLLLELNAICWFLYLTSLWNLQVLWKHRCTVKLLWFFAWKSFVKVLLLNFL